METEVRRGGQRSRLIREKPEVSEVVVVPETREIAVLTVESGQIWEGLPAKQTGLRVSLWVLKEEETVIENHEWKEVKIVAGENKERGIAEVIEKRLKNEVTWLVVVGGSVRPNKEGWIKELIRNIPVGMTLAVSINTKGTTVGAYVVNVKQAKKLGISVNESLGKGKTYRDCLFQTLVLMGDYKKVHLLDQVGDGKALVYIGEDKLIKDRPLEKDVMEGVLRWEKPVTNL